VVCCCLPSPPVQSPHRDSFWIGTVTGTVTRKRGALAMKKEFEVRHEKQKKLAEIRVVNSETVSEAPL